MLMKKTLLLQLAFLSTATSLTAQHAALSNVKQNIVYTGVANPMEAVAENIPCKSLTLHTDNGRFEKQDECAYSFYPERTGIAKIQLLKGTKLVREFTFRVKTPPPPTAAIAGKSNTVIQADVLREQIGVTAVLNNFDYDVRYIITAFTLTLVKKGRATSASTLSGPYFNDRMKQLLQTAAPGDQIVIDEIFADGPAQKNITVPTMALTVE